MVYNNSVLKQRILCRNRRIWNWRYYMNIRNCRELKQTAAQRLAGAPHAPKLSLIYAGITVGLSALVTLVHYCLSLEISQTGGLSNIGLRSFLSTIQTVLPIVQGVVIMCLELGYCNAMLRISREQYASPNALRMGIQRFWPLLRCSLLQWLIYLGITFLSIYLGVQIFLITPLSNNAMAIMSDMMGGLNAGMTIDSTMMLDEAMYTAFYNAMLPVFPIVGIVFLLFFIPVFYQYRMTSYVLVDNPGMHAILVLRQSKQLMRRNRLALLKLDLSLWWYYLLSLLAAVVAYGDVLLPMLGITLPFSETTGYFLFYGVYLVVQFAICWLFLNRVSVTYALAYQSILPEKPKDNGVVLGNIFQM